MAGLFRSSVSRQVARQIPKRHFSGHGDEAAHHHAEVEIAMGSHTRSRCQTYRVFRPFQPEPPGPPPTRPYTLIQSLVDNSALLLPTHEGSRCLIPWLRKTPLRQVEKWKKITAVGALPVAFVFLQFLFSDHEVSFKPQNHQHAIL
jgi:hypothetical protein